MVDHERAQTQGLRKGRQNREWKCTDCNQAFKKREHLVRHIRSHTKEKPYACDVCPKTYGRQDSLIRHARTHAPMQTDYTSLPDASILSPPGNDADTSNGRLSATYWRPDDTQDHVSRRDVSAARRSIIANPAGATAPETRSRAGLVPGVTDIGPDSDLDSPMHSSRVTQSNSLNPGGLPNTFENTSTDMGLLDFECNTPDPSWLLGDDFDLNTLDCSIATTGSLWDYGETEAALQNVNQSMTYEMDTVDYSSQAAAGRDVWKKVQARWYTRPTFDGSNGPPSSMRQENGDRVDEAYRAGLSRRLRPSPHDSALPSADFLNLCIKLYFAKFQPIFPLIHSASFRPCSENALLLLSICSLGALFVGSASAAARGRAIFIKLNKTILASWQTYVFRGGREALSVAQAAVLGQTFGMLSGNPNDLLLAESFHGTIIAWTRQAGMFQIKDSLMGAKLLDYDVESAWRSWSQAEEAIRVLLALHVHDSEFATVFHHEPLLRHHITRLPRCCSDELFTASTAKQWHEMAKTMESPAPAASGQNHNLAVMPAVPRDHALMHSYTVLAGRIAEICESRCGTLDNAAVEEYRSALMAWQLPHSTSSRYPIRDPSCLMVLWHEAFMSLYVDFDLLERVLGREGPSRSQDDVDRIRSWVNEPEGQHCAVHAMLIYKRLETLPINTEPAIHVPKALFYSGLVIYCFVKFRPAGMSYGDIDTPELRSGQLSRYINPAPPHPPSAVLHQLDSSALYNVADLLRRQGHWEVSRRFAWILDALIDTLADSALDT